MTLAIQPHVLRLDDSLAGMDAVSSLAERLTVIVNGWVIANPRRMPNQNHFGSTWASGSASSGHDLA